MTEQEAYDRLADFIQDYIYEKKWEHLSPMQIEAVEKVLMRRKNLLFTAGTAMGKTEAALMPAITHICAHPPNSVGILYISPLKALINDQFARMEEMLAGTQIQITRWHQDAAVSKKEKLLFCPGGILQTTPESLEAMLCRRPQHVSILFSDLRYVIIDELHYFMGSFRGLQLLAILERIQRRIQTIPVRLGLSATISNTKGALAYLNAGSRREAEVISYRDERRQYLVCVTATRFKEVDYPSAYCNKIFKQSLGKRALLFTNSRRECEILISHIRRMALKAGYPDCYYIHHGSISKNLREDAEHHMKDGEGPVLTGTTLTLELGIDIGDLDEVIQASQPMQISSMVQRVGRSGRKTLKSCISFHLRYFESSDGILENLDLSLVRTIAMIELYFREKHLEQTKVPLCPVNLLVHEVLAVICEQGCLQPPHLAQAVLELSVFQALSLEDLRLVLRTMIQKDFLKVYEDGAIGLSDTGEKICCSMGFYAVFEADETFSVYWNNNAIGTVDKAYKTDECFFLAGKTWTVLGCDLKHKRIDVEPGKDKADIHFNGKGNLKTDRRTMEKIRQILKEENEYSYLDEEAMDVLREIRSLARYFLLGELLVKEPGTDNLLLFPALGTDTIRTLYYIWRSNGISCEKVLLRGLLYGIRVYAMDDPVLKQKIRRILSSGCPVDRAFLLKKERAEGKYFDMLPEALKFKELCQDVLDLDGAAAFMKELMEDENATKFCKNYIS